MKNKHFLTVCQLKPLRTYCNPSQYQYYIDPLNSFGQWELIITNIESDGEPSEMCKTVFAIVSKCIMLSAYSNPPTKRAIAKAMSITYQQRYYHKPFQCNHTFRYRRWNTKYMEYCARRKWPGHAMKHTTLLAISLIGTR